MTISISSEPMVCCFCFLCYFCKYSIRSYNMNFSLSTILDPFVRLVSKSYNRLESLTEGVGHKKILWGLIILICFSIILFLNVLTPMIADDFGYLYIFGEKEQVSSLSDLIHSQKNHYMWWGGRSVVHFMAQALLQAPPLLADVLNSIVYILFISLIYFHIKGRDKKSSLSLFILMNLAVWFSIPMFGDTVLWITGSANYLWGTSIVLLFLLPYRLYSGTENKVSKEVWMSALMLVFGIIAGWTNENTVAGMIVIILLLFLYYRSQKWSVPPALVIGLLGVVIGYAIMILAPGNFVRGKEAPELSLFLVGYRIFMYTQSLFLNYGVLIALYLILIALFGRKDKKGNSFYLSIIYILGALAAIYAMIFSPQFPARAWFGLISYLLIAIGIMLYRLDYQEKFMRQMRASVILVGSVAFMFSLYWATKDIYRIYEIDKEREVIAKTAVNAGEDVCYFTRFVPYTTYVHGEDEQSNMLLSYYYGIFVEYKY